VPLPFLSSASHASSEFAAVQDNRSGVPSELRSKETPAPLAVKLKPLPATSTTIGEWTLQPQFMSSHQPPLLVQLYASNASQLQLPMPPSPGAIESDGSADKSGAAAAPSQPPVQHIPLLGYVP
jgi:hypothetical protein